MHQVVQTGSRSSTTFILCRKKHRLGYLVRGMPIINAALENSQVEYHTSMVEVEGMLNYEPISILIDPGDSLSYVSPSLLEKC